MTCTTETQSNHADDAVESVTHTVVIFIHLSIHVVPTFSRGWWIYTLYLKKRHWCSI